MNQFTYYAFGVCIPPSLLIYYRLILLDILSYSDYGKRRQTSIYRATTNL
jgi:hypothetical protein